MRNIIDIVAEMADWGRKLPNGRGLGIAMHRSFVTSVATVVEVEVSQDGQLAIPAVWSAIDAGTVVNRRHVAAQVEGGTLYGLSNALYGEITAKHGAVVQGNFPDWRVMRIHEAPRAFTVHIVESDAPPGEVRRIGADCWASPPCSYQSDGVQDLPCWRAEIMIRSVNGWAYEMPIEQKTSRQ